jgi:hypothetical protein
MEKLLKAQGSSLDKFPPMPVSQMGWTVLLGNHLLMEQKDYDQDQQQQMADQRIPNLNPDQRSAFDQIMHAVDTHSGQCFFLYGPGGTGKTYVYNTLCYALRAKGTIVLCVASSGIAALILIGGRTSHSRLKIPIAVDKNSFCSIKRGSLEAELIQQTSLLIYDEITMQHRHCQEAFDCTYRDIRDSDMPFGGLTVVFGGDFQQIILPVIVPTQRLSMPLYTVHTYGHTQRSFLSNSI